MEQEFNSCAVLIVGGIQKRDWRGYVSLSIKLISIPMKRVPEQ